MLDKSKEQNIMQVNKISNNNTNKQINLKGKNMDYLLIHKVVTLKGVFHWIYERNGIDW